MSLKAYRAKRDFTKTAEPKGTEGRSQPTDHAYLIQKHAARRLHYDLRLQIGDQLKSWAVTKGPSLNPRDRRLAVHVEDHPLDYGSFEGTIPKGEYGGGTVMLWDRGRWEPQGDAERDYRAGRLKFRLFGEKLQGGWMLLRMKPRSPRDKDNWLLIKERDEAARDDGDILDEQPDSVASGRSLEAIGAAAHAVWHSNRGANGKATKPPFKAATATVPVEPTRLRGAKRAALPSAIEPELATAVRSVPAGPEWLHEIKFDGYRALARIDQPDIAVLTRNRLDWSGKVPSLVDALRQLPVKQAILDGEIVVLGNDGVSDFGALQAAFADRDDSRMAYYLFDLIHLDGRDLSALPLERRKAILQDLLSGLPAESPIKFSDHMGAHGPSFYQHSCRLGLEGVVSKRRDSPYRPGRGTDWVKSKCIEREELVIGGYSKPTHPGPGLGALLVGYYDRAGRLIYAGKVGTGFTERVSKNLRAQLDRIARAATPFAALPRLGRDKIVHVEPEMVAEIEFTAWTEDGLLRHPSFKGIREDKTAQEVTRDDRAEPVSGKPAKKSKTATRGESSAKPTGEGTGEPIIAGVKITHPDRVLHLGQGLTKLGLAQYYAEVAPWILPELIGRPLSLFRCPGDHKQGCFFQKHIKDGMSPALRQIPVPEKDGIATYIGIDDVTGLIALVQFGVVEFHPWGSRADDLEHPDRLIFDLDPDPSVAWPAVTGAALALRARLESVGLRSFLKTTGGKGLHVVVPILPDASWADAKSFARSIAEDLVAEAPDAYVATMTKAKRKGKIFIDFFRNDRGATAVSAYSTRARSGAPIATPIGWDELESGLRGDHFNVGNIFRRLTTLDADPWADIYKIRQRLPLAGGAKTAGEPVKRRSRAS